MKQQECELSANLHSVSVHDSIALVRFYFSLKMRCNSSLEKTHIYPHCVEALWGDEFEIWKHNIAGN